MIVDRPRLVPVARRLITKRELAGGFMSGMVFVNAPSTLSKLPLLSQSEHWHCCSGSIMPGPVSRIEGSSARGSEKVPKTRHVGALRQEQVRWTSPFRRQ